MSFLILILSAFSAIASPCKRQVRVVYFNMPLVIGKSIFNDQVEICKNSKGELLGQLTVPNRFKATLENIKLEKEKLSFSITANEGRGKFQVFYKGELKENKKYYLGIARLKNKKILGPFVGVASDKKETLKIVQ